MPKTIEEILADMQRQMSKRAPMGRSGLIPEGMVPGGQAVPGELQPVPLPDRNPMAQQMPMQPMTPEQWQNGTDESMRRDMQRARPAPDQLSPVPAPGGVVIPPPPPSKNQRQGEPGYRIQASNPLQPGNRFLGTGQGSPFEMLIRAARMGA